MTGTDITVLRTPQHYSTDSLWLAVCLHYANIFASFIHVKEWRLHSTKCQLKLFLLSLVFLLCSIWNLRVFFCAPRSFRSLVTTQFSRIKNPLAKPKDRTSSETMVKFKQNPTPVRLSSLSYSKTNTQLPHYPTSFSELLNGKRTLHTSDDREWRNFCISVANLAIVQPPIRYYYSRISDINCFFSKHGCAKCVIKSGSIVARKKHRGT